MKKLLLICALALFCAGATFAQSATKLSELIESPAATYGQVAYLVAVYQNKVSEDASYQQAFDALVQDGLIASSAKQSDVINLADASYLVAQATGIKGGLFYTLFPSPRYAYKELKAKEILPQYTDSNMTVLGRDVIALLNSCIAETEGAQ